MIASKYYLSVLIAFSVALSLVHSFSFHIRISVDALAYDQIGLNLASGNGYVEDARNSDTPWRDNAIARVGPGYQFFLASVYRVVGHAPWVVWILQALLRGASVYLVFLIALRLGLGKSAALFGAALFALYPDLTILSSMLLTETLALFMALLFFLVALVYFVKPSVLGAGAIGFLGTSTFLIRTTFLPVAGLIGLWCLWQRKFLHAAIILGVLVVMVAPWTWRNWQVFERFIPTNAVGGYDLWVGNHHGAKGGFEKSPEIQALRNKTHIVEMSDIGIREYFSFIKKHPGEFVSLQIRKASMYFSLLRPTGFWPYLNDRPWTQRIVVAASTIVGAFLWIVGVAGLFLLGRSKTRAGIFLALAACLQPLTVIPIIVESRYRLMLIPLLALGAAYTYSSGERWKYIRWAGIVLGTATVLDVAFHWTEFSLRLSQLI